MADRSSSSSPGSPGVSGALKDAVSAVADYVAPRSVSRRKQTVSSQEEDATGRMRDAQTSDRANNYNGY